MCQSGNKDINEANKKFCSHEDYLLEGKRHSMKERKNKKKITCRVSYGERAINFYLIRQSIYGQ